MRVTTVITVILVTGIFFVSVVQCWASTNVVFISEVYPAPANQEAEWVELYNPASEVATLSGYLLYDQLSSPSLIAEIDTVEIPAVSTLVLELQSQKLNNSGDAVVLYDNLEQEVDRLNFGSTNSQQSWSKTTRDGTPTQGTPSKGMFVLVSSTATPSPIPATSTPSPSSTVTPQPQDSLLQSVFLTEVMSCPITGESEWLELYNQGAKPIEINNWRASDAQANHAEISGLLPANSYAVFSWSKAMLNNQGDSLLLQTDTGQTVASVQLASCSAGQTFTITDGSATLAESPSPGEVNPVSESANSDSDTSTTDRVSAATGAVLGASQAYIQNSNFIPNLLPLTIETLTPHVYMQTKLAQLLRPNQSKNWMLYGTISSSVIALLSLFLLYYDFTQ